VAGFCERGNEPLGSINCGELHQLRNAGFSGRLCSIELVMFMVNFVLVLVNVSCMPWSMTLTLVVT
jgi:hypothetical protein